MEGGVEDGLFYFVFVFDGRVGESLDYDTTFRSFRLEIFLVIFGLRHLVLGPFRQLRSFKPRLQLIAHFKVLMRRQLRIIISENQTGRQPVR